MRAALARVSLPRWRRLRGPVGENSSASFGSGAGSETCAHIGRPTNHLDIKCNLPVGTVRTTGQDDCRTSRSEHRRMYCDEIYVLKEGRIYTRGTPEAVLTRQ